MNQYEWTSKGFVYHELEQKDGALIDWDGVAVPDEVSNALSSLDLPEGQLVDICVNFYAELYYRPAQLSGPPERCHEAEESDERSLDHVEVILYHGPGIKRTCITLRPEIGQTIFDAYEREIYAADVEERDNDGDE